MSQPPTPASLVARLRETLTAAERTPLIIRKGYPSQVSVLEVDYIAVLAALREAADTMAALLAERAGWEAGVTPWREQAEAAEAALTEAQRQVTLYKDWMQSAQNFVEYTDKLLTANGFDCEAGITDGTQQLLAALTEARQAREAEYARKRQPCPCLHTTPCHPDCTCVNPVMSRGCERCCTYGSPEQQKAAAERFAALTAENNRLLTVLREVSEYLDGSNYATDSGDLPDTVRAALASPPEAPQSSG